jgi:hypothetical protein
MGSSRRNAALVFCVCFFTGACTRHAQLVHLASGEVLRGEMHKTGLGSCRMEFRDKGGRPLTGTCSLEGAGSNTKVTPQSPDGRVITPAVSTTFTALRGAAVLTGDATSLNCVFVVRRLSWHGKGTCRDGNGDNYRLVF